MRSKRSKTNDAFIRRWFEEVWNQGREEAIDEMFGKEGLAHGLSEAPGGDLRGPSEFKPFFRRFREAFPEIEVVVEETISEGDKVVARCTVRGLHRGHTLGIRATEKPVEFEGVSIVRVSRGKIVEAWNFFDFMSMFRQLGALRIEEAAPAPDQQEALPSLD